MSSTYYHCDVYRPRADTMTTAKRKLVPALSELDRRVISRAVSDPVFRRAMIEDPRAAIEQTFSVHLPAGLSIEVHVNSPETVHVVLPPERDEFASGDADLVLFWERYLSPA